MSVPTGTVTFLFTPELINQPYQPDDFADVIEGLRLAGLEEDD